MLKFRVVYFYSGSTGLSICADLMGRGPDPLRKIKRIIFIPKIGHESYLCTFTIIKKGDHVLI